MNFYNSLCIILFLKLIKFVFTLMLSKSNVQICENRGLHGHGDPQNLVDGKACQKKLLVAMTVRNNQVRICSNKI